LKATVNIIKDLVDVISATVIITNATDNLDGTFTLESENTYWLSKDDTITIDSETYVVTVFHQNIDFTIMPTGNGGLPTVDSFELQQPTYIHGTLRMAKNEVNAIKNKMDLVPFVYLYEVIRDKKNTDEASAIDRETILRIFFLNSSSFKDMLTEDVYEYIINPMQTMVDELLNKVKNSRYFTENMDYETIPLVNFSDEGEQQKSIFDINLSGIELRLSAEIRKDLSCNDYIPINPIPQCLDAELIINEDTEISLGSGDTFDLSVTLNGTPSGSYNALTDTWEVESEPCEPIRVTFDNYLIEETSVDLNIDCSTYLNMAIVSNNVDVNGNWIEGATVNGKPSFSLLGNNLYYNGSEWEFDYPPPSGIQATAGNESYPWLATWSGVTVVEGTIENYCSEPCAAATYTIKDSAATTLYSGSIGSGGDLQRTITDGVITLKDTANATISTTNVKAQESKNITAPDGAVTVNSAAFGNVKSNGTLDVEVEYSDATNVGTISGGKVLIPNNRYNTASIIKTGQTTSYGDDDDGALERGSGTDFLTLSYNNPFGNTNRFTDSAGGQTYANGEAYDWGNADYVNRLVPIWYLTPQTAATWANAMTNQPYTVNSQSWYIPNVQEAYTLMNMGVGSARLNYAPFNLSSSVSGQGFWTSTTNRDATTTAFRIAVDAALGAASTGLGVTNAAKTATANFLLIRYASY